VTAEQIAELLHGRHVGGGRWMMRCPAHRDRSPSLSIREGRDGRVLLMCFAGCTLTDILRVAGLRMRDLFQGLPPSPAEQRKTAAARDAQQREIKFRNCAVGTLSDDVRWLHIAATWLGAKLASTAENDPVEDTLAQQYHATLGRLREAEGELARQ
jgi:hypothetical protein